MRSSWKLTGLLLLVALTGACDSTQPQQVGQQSLELRVIGVGAQMPSYFVYQFYEDLPPYNQQQDPGEDLYLFCKDAAGFQDISPQSVPWNYSLEVSILRAGETAPEVITSPEGLDVEFNLTEYDTSVGSGSTPFRNPIVLDNGRTFRFLNPGRILSAANREVRMATSNPLSDSGVAPYGTVGQGRCSAGDPGEPMIDGGGIPLVLDLQKGDTVVVNLRRANDLPDNFPNDPDLLTAEPRIRAILSLGGRELQVRGEAVTGLEPSSGISFSYTLL